ncbi:uncharacterized protein LOC119674624 [Teleopsis dalmanni]|uniref:uncharacterized protein LOC119674624 n=1 Tax=Teleopsis dalmanni TaxID=139649 RepID=UPI0018CD4218|nr:uncharacterized protein LOC119674624 [Teleopsis dalmanni]
MVEGAVNCDQKPHFSNFMTCCKLPTVNFNSYSNCSQYQKSNDKVPSMCALDCLFRESKALDNDQLNMSNLRTMLKNVISNSEFMDVFLLSFDQCKTPVYEKIKNFKISSRIPLQGKSLFQQCSPVASLYANCALKNSFLNCPSTSWNKTSNCETAKEYLATCAKNFERGGGKLIVRGANRSSDMNWKVNSRNKTGNN